jgi:hypothetical protein
MRAHAPVRSQPGSTMQGVLFGLFKDLATAERVHAQLMANGIAPDAAVLHHQDVPIAGGREEKPGQARPRDQPGVLSGLFQSLFDSSGEMDDSASTHSFRQALHRGDYAVSVNVASEAEMAMAEKLFTENGAVLQLHPDA